MGTVTDPDTVVFDTETTGFKPHPSPTPATDPADGDRLLEIACIRIDASGREVSRWSTLLNPGPGVPLGATDIHGITAEHLAGAPQFADVVGDFVEIVDGAILAAHNSPFDVKFLKSELLRAGHPWPDPVVADTLGAARFLMPGLSSYKLGDLAGHLGIGFDGAAHSALADAGVTVGLYRHLVSLTRSVSWPDPSAVAWPRVAPSGMAKQR